MKLYITGCGRSGTTLLRRLFHAFEETTVIDSEIGVRAFVSLPDAPCLVGKRTIYSLLSNSIPISKERRQRSLLTSQNVQLINVMRDGIDTIEKGGASLAERWMASFDAYMRNRDMVAMTVFYEGLVQEPNVVQAEIGERFGLTSDHCFSDYPSFVPVEAFRQVVHREEYEARPLDVSGVGKTYDWNVLLPPEMRDEFMSRVEEYRQLLREARTQ